MLKTLLPHLSKKDKQYLEENGMPPVCGIPLFFCSSASPQHWLNLLNIWGGNAQENQNVVLYPLYGGQGSNTWNSTWQITPEGYIVCPFYPQFVIGLYNGILSIVLRSDNDTSQLWTFKNYGNGYTITNSSTQAVITTSTQNEDNPNSPGTISMLPLNGNPPSAEQLWKPLPAERANFYIPEKRVYIQTQMSGPPGTNNSSWVVTIDPSNSNQVNLAPLVPGNPDQIWIMKPDGTIESASNESNILISNSTDGPKSTTPVTIAAAGTAAAQANYTWTFAGNFLSVNLGGNIGEIGLNANQSTWGDALITYENTGGQNCFWYIFPEQSTIPDKWIYLAITSSSGVTAVLTVETYYGAVGASLQLLETQHGNPAQLWRINAQGFLVSALSADLVLSIDTTNNNNALVLQTQGLSGCVQSWCYCPNGAFITNVSPQSFYLTELSFPNGSTPGGVSAETQPDNSTPGTNALWDIIGYEPDLSGQWFTIYSGLSSPETYQSYLLTLDDNWNTLHLNPPLGNNILREGTPSFSQLWRLTLDGYIVNAVNPYLAVTYSPDTQNAIMEAIQPGNANQQWYWGNTVDTSLTKKKLNVLGGTLLNSASGLALYSTDLGSVGSNAISIQAQNSTTNTPNQLWYMMPYSTNYDQPTTIRNLGGKQKTSGLFITLQEHNDNSYSLTVGQTGSDPSLTVWKFIYPGYIVSIANSNIVLSLSVTGSSGDLSYGPEVVAGLRLPYPESWQLWTANDDGLLINNKTGWALCAVTAAEGSSLSTSKIGTTADSNPELDLQLWEFAAGKAFQTVLVQPPVAYHPGDSNEELYYTQISNYLGLPLGLRSQYMNLSAPLSSYQTEMNAYVMEQTGGAPTGDWLTILKQLNRELTSVIGVQRFFQTAGAFHQALSLAQSMLLSELITACALNNTTTVAPKKKNKSWIWDLCEGIIYTGLNIGGSLIGDPELGKQARTTESIVKNGFPILANLMSTTFTSGQAYMEGRSHGSNYSTVLQHIYNYEMTVLQLQENLLKVFEASGNALAQIETLVLSDWGKIEAVYEMTKIAGGLDSLYWTPDLSPGMAKNALSAYASRVLQILMPAINPAVSISESAYCAYPADKSWMKLNSGGNTFAAENLDQSMSSMSTVNISAQVLNLLWSNGTKPIDFFRQTNGWDCITLTYYNLVSGGAGTNWPHNAGVVVTIQNCTTQAFSVDLSQITNGLSQGQSSALAGNPTQSRTLAPLGLAQFAAYSWYADSYGGNTAGDNFGAYGNFYINVGTSSTAAVTVYLNSNAHSGIYKSEVPVYDVTLTPNSPYKAEQVSRVSNQLTLITIYIYE
jgi:hypothetical protein